MEKDNDLKNDPGYQFNNLRGRITEGVKHLRDAGDEMKQPSAKTLPMIPVTGAGGKGLFKHYQNKSDEKI